ncbi:MAG: hypothetical protein PHV13_00995 [Candidatus ainarchaeum sp.]|nr:hypothetical protein [Candidatus ainarchaeum sp.]
MARLLSLAVFCYRAAFLAGFFLLASSLTLVVFAAFIIPSILSSIPGIFLPLWIALFLCLCISGVIFSVLYSLVPLPTRLSTALDLWMFQKRFLRNAPQLLEGEQMLFSPVPCAINGGTARTRVMAQDVMVTDKRIVTSGFLDGLSYWYAAPSAPASFPGSLIGWRWNITSLSSGSDPRLGDYLEITSPSRFHQLKITIYHPQALSIMARLPKYLPR